jgi:hypothetical protein
MAHVSALFVVFFFCITKFTKARLPTRPASMLRIANQPRRTRALLGSAGAGNVVRCGAITNGTHIYDCGGTLSSFSVAEHAIE